MDAVDQVVGAELGPFQRLSRNCLIPLQGSDVYQIEDNEGIRWHSGTGISVYALIS